MLTEQARLLADYNAALPGARPGEFERVARLIAGAATRRAEILVTLRKPAGQAAPNMDAGNCGSLSPP